VRREEQKVRILVADDQTKVRSALRLVIEQEPGFEVIDEVETPNRLLSMIEETQPDILLLDWGFGSRDRMHLLQTLKGKFPNLKVIVLSTCILDRQKALSAGAYCFVSKVDPVETLIQCLQNLSYVMEPKAYRHGKLQA
jgi:DNA-binding NarL/FixJ family response regulator